MNNSPLKGSGSRERLENNISTSSPHMGHSQRSLHLSFKKKQFLKIDQNNLKIIKALVNSKPQVATAK